LILVFYVSTESMQKSRLLSNASKSNRSAGLRLILGLSLSCSTVNRIIKSSRNRDLVSKKADVALGALSVMAERENVIDFTVPYYDLVGISILMKKPKVRRDMAQCSSFW
jgi:hypothetical protein